MDYYERQMLKDAARRALEDMKQSQKRLDRLARILAIAFTLACVLAFAAILSYKTYMDAKEKKIWQAGKEAAEIRYNYRAADEARKAAYKNFFDNGKRMEKKGNHAGR